jgi:hypothetical protein
LASAIIGHVANRFWSRIAGLGALLGGIAWLVKSTWILTERAQPFLLFEVAPLFFAVTVTSLGQVSDGVGTHRRAAVPTLGCIGAIAATVAATTEIAGNLWGPSIAVAVLAVVAGLLLDRRRSPTDRLAWWIGAVLLPAVLLGGVLTVVDERLLELPLAFIAALWIWLGGLGGDAPDIDASDFDGWEICDCAFCAMHDVLPAHNVLPLPRSVFG